MAEKRKYTPGPKAFFVRYSLDNQIKWLKKMVKNERFFRKKEETHGENTRANYF